MRRQLLCSLATLTCLALGGCVSTAVRYQPTPGELSDVGPALDAYSQATVPKTGLIVVEGDGFAYGAVMRGKGARMGDLGAWRAKTPFPEALGELLGVRVENRGTPGQTLAEAEGLWGDKPCGSLLILSYGYEDALKGRKAADFAGDLARRVADAHAHGASVIVVLPPHFKSKAIEAAAERQRSAVRAAQASLGVGLVDLEPVFDKINPRPTSGAYQSQAAYMSVAYALAAYIAVAADEGAASPRAPSLTPQP